MAAGGAKSSAVYDPVDQDRAPRHRDLRPRDLGTDANVPADGNDEWLFPRTDGVALMARRDGPPTIVLPT
jgi:hypothetical protein